MDNKEDKKSKDVVIKLLPITQRMLSEIMVGVNIKKEEQIHVNSSILNETPILKYSELEEFDSNIESSPSKQKDTNDNFKSFIKSSSTLSISSDHVENVDTPVLSRKRKISKRIATIDSNNKDNYEIKKNHTTNESPQNSRSQPQAKLAKKFLSLNDNSMMFNSSKSTQMKTEADLKPQFGVKKSSHVIKNERKTPSPQKHQQEWKGPDFNLNLSPLGVDNHLNSWIMTQEKLEVMSANPTLEVDLHIHSQQLNDLYIDIHEKFHSIFDKIPLKVLEKFPEFDPAVFNNLNILKEHVQTKRIMTEEKIRQIRSSEHRGVEGALISSSTEQRENGKVSSPPMQKLPAATNQPSSKSTSSVLQQSVVSKGTFQLERPVTVMISEEISKQIIALIMKAQSVQSRTSGTKPPTVKQEENSPEKSKSESFYNPSGFDDSSALTVEQSQRLSTDKITVMSSLSNDLYQSKTNEVEVAKPTGKFVGNIINSGLTGEFDGFNYPFSEELMRILRTKFGLTEFRPNQLQVINAVLTGHDCFVLMPTGGGKSLCYQLPALLCKGVTIVITPSESLAVDHVQYLNSLNINSCYLLEEISSVVYEDLIKETPTIKLLYVTPEKFSLSIKFLNVLQRLYHKNLIARFVIDDAHLVSQWCHYSNPDYKEFRYLKQHFPNVRITALTTTAWQEVKLGLGLTDLKWFLDSFHRPNLKYQVIDKKELICCADVTRLIKEKYHDCCGIIYCFSKQDCDEYAKNLNINGIKAASYHTSMIDEQRNEIRLMWNAEIIKVICATMTFGMDIDKPNVRFVIHTAIPKSIEDYYQESSHAGRDGENADCIIFYNYLDTVRMRETMVDVLPNTRQKHLINLAKMVMFCENKVDCRRTILLQHLGEIFDRSECWTNKTTTCDNCRNKALKELKD